MLRSGINFSIVWIKIIRLTGKDAGVYTKKQKELNLHGEFPKLRFCGRTMTLQNVHMIMQR